MNIVHYPHPTLRHISKPVRRVDAQLRKIVREMFDLMYEFKGIGLSANQVDLPLRLFVANLQSDPDEGQELVFINPVLRNAKGSEEKEEGCLSFPGLYADVRRPEQITVNAYTVSGEEIEVELDGLAARAVQHEVDHLDGVVFTDRLSETGKLAAKDALEELESQFRSRCEQGTIGTDGQIAVRLAELEQQYC